MSRKEPETEHLVDRSRSILTPDDRKYLLGIKDIDGQQENDKRYRIRKRLVNGLIDLFILSENLETRDRTKSFLQFPYKDANKLESIRRFIEEGADESFVDSNLEEQESNLYNIIEDSLTRQQIDVVLKSYEMGYFDWPRQATGEEISDELGLSSPTFHQHLRVAMRKIIVAYLGERRENEGDS